jgi:hypothetical protein
MRFSAFTPFGQWRFSGRTPPAQLIYEDMVRNLGGEDNYTSEFDSIAMGRLYATAICVASSRGCLERSGNQFRPSRALELLPALESQVGRITEPGETIEERRQIVAALLRVTGGALFENVDSVMRTAIGDDFVAYQPTELADAVAMPNDPTASASWVEAGTQKGIYRIESFIVDLGTPISVQYTRVFADSDLLPGDVVVLDHANHGRREAVTVESVSVEDDETTWFTATFTHPHNEQTTATTGRYPAQASSKRHNLFLLTADAAIRNKTRKTVGFFANRLLRGVSTWSITDGSGPFRVGVGRLGVTTIGDIS